MFYNLHDQSGPGWTLHHAECIERMRAMPPDTVDAILTDPPYHLTSIKARYGKTDIDRDGTNETRARNRSDAMARLAGGFMGKAWDGGDVAFRVETWQAAYRVLKPGGYLMAFASSRGYHRMTVAIEDAGFIIHPLIGWVFGNGFPKATDASRMIDQALGVKGCRTNGVSGKGSVTVSAFGDGLNVNFEQRPAYAPATPEAAAWNGWYYGGQVRKPALEPICVAQKPFSEKNGALNILRWGVGAVNIDGCRVGDEVRHNSSASYNKIYGQFKGNETEGRPAVGRWPANLMHDGSPEVLALFPVLKARSNRNDSAGKGATPDQVYAGGWGDRDCGVRYNRDDPDMREGSAARFFECYPPVITYCPKANARDRLGSRHPTVKPMTLIRALVRHVTPPGGTVLDPFAGTGTTLRAAVLEGVNAIGIEADATSIVDTVWRMRHAQPE